MKLKGSIITIVTGVLGAMSLVAMAAPSQAAQRSGPERFVVIFTASSDTGRVVASGPISGVGTVASADSAPGEPFGATFSLPGGSVFLTITPTANSENTNPRSCVATVTQTDTFTITGGTGAFAGATGSGTDTGRGTFVASRNPDGTCNLNARPVAGAFVVRLSGTAQVGS